MLQPAQLSHSFAAPITRIVSLHPGEAPPQSSFSYAVFAGGGLEETGENRALANPSGAGLP